MEWNRAQPRAHACIHVRVWLAWPGLQVFERAPVEAQYLLTYTYVIEEADLRAHVSEAAARRAACACRHACTGTGCMRACTTPH